METKEESRPRRKFYRLHWGLVFTGDVASGEEAALSHRPKQVFTPEQDRAAYLYYVDDEIARHAAYRRDSRRFF